MSIRVLVYVVWTWSDSLADISLFHYLDVIDFWVPVAGGVLGLTFITIALLAVLRKSKWWLAVVGSVFAPLAPVVWQLFPVTKDPMVVIPRVTGILAGATAIVLVLISRSAFGKRANR